MVLWTDLCNQDDNKSHESAFYILNELREFWDVTSLHSLNTTSWRSVNSEFIRNINILTWTENEPTDVQCTYRNSPVVGVSSHGDVGDSILSHRPLCVIPADSEAAGGGIKHMHVPGTGPWHCTRNTQDELIPLHYKLLSIVQTWPPMETYTTN